MTRIDNYLEKYLDGSISREELAEFQKLLEEEPKLQSELSETLELRSIIHDDLLELSVPEDISFSVRNAVGERFAALATEQHLVMPVGRDEDEEEEEKRRRALPLFLNRRFASSMAMAMIAMVMIALTPTLNFYSPGVDGPTAFISTERTEAASEGSATIATSEDLAAVSNSQNGTEVSGSTTRTERGERRGDLTRGANATVSQRNDVAVTQSETEHETDVMLRSAEGASTPQLDLNGSVAQTSQPVSSQEVNSTANLTTSSNGASQPQTSESTNGVNALAVNTDSVNVITSLSMAVRQIAEESQSNQSLLDNSTDRYTIGKDGGLVIATPRSATDHELGGPIASSDRNELAIIEVDRKEAAKNESAWQRIMVGGTLGSGLTTASSTIGIQGSAYLAMGLNENNRIGLEGGSAMFRYRREVQVPIQNDVSTQGLARRSSGSSSNSGPSYLLSGQGNDGSANGDDRGGQPDATPDSHSERVLGGDESITSGGDKLQGNDNGFVNNYSPGNRFHYDVQSYDDDASIVYGLVFYDYTVASLNSNLNLHGRIGIGGADGGMIFNARAYAAISTHENVAWTLGVGGALLHEFARDISFNANYGINAGIELGF